MDIGFVLKQLDTQFLVPTLIVVNQVDEYFTNIHLVTLQNPDFPH